MRLNKIKFNNQVRELHLRAGERFDLSPAYFLEDQDYDRSLDWNLQVLLPSFVDLDPPPPFGLYYENFESIIGQAPPYPGQCAANVNAFDHKGNPAGSYTFLLVISEGRVND